MVGRGTTAGHCPKHGKTVVRQSPQKCRIMAFWIIWWVLGYHLIYFWGPEMSKDKKNNTWRASFLELSNTMYDCIVSAAMCGAMRAACTAHPTKIQTVSFLACSEHVSKEMGG